MPRKKTKEQDIEVIIPAKQVQLILNEWWLIYSGYLRQAYIDVGDVIIEDIPKEFAHLIELFETFELAVNCRKEQ